MYDIACSRAALSTKSLYRATKSCFHGYAYMALHALLVLEPRPLCKDDMQMQKTFQFFSQSNICKIDGNWEYMSLLNVNDHDGMNIIIF